LDTLAAATGLSVSTLYRKAAAGQLELVKIGTRCTRVRAAHARNFIEMLGRAA
jgi:predicted DNA-binding transcriptional regulator AlpA